MEPARPAHSPQLQTHPFQHVPHIRLAQKPSESGAMISAEISVRDSRETSEQDDAVRREESREFALKLGLG